MDKVLRPDKLEVDAQTPDAAAIYDFWERSVKNLIQSSFAESTEEEKLFVLTQYLTYKTFPIIKEAKKYSEALLLLQKHFIKPKNISFARYLLYNRKQNLGEQPGIAWSDLSPKRVGGFWIGGAGVVLAGLFTSSLFNHQ